MSIFDHPIGVRFIVGAFGTVNLSIVLIFWTGLQPEKDSNEKPSERGVAHDSGATTFIIDNRSMPKVSTTHNPDEPEGSNKDFVRYIPSDREDGGLIPRERLLPPPTLRY